MNSVELYKQVQATQRDEQAASQAHDAAELLGSGPAYQAAFDALSDARIALQEAVQAYDAAVAAEEAAEQRAV